MPGRPRPFWLAAILLCPCAVSSCTQGAAGPAHARHATPPAATAARSPGARNRAATPPAVLRAATEPWRLSHPVSREVVLADGPFRILVLGGLTTAGTVARITAVDTATGAMTSGGRLAVPTHDAAGAVVAGRKFVFGGGSVASITAVQALNGKGRAVVVAHLPQRRSDLAAAVVGRTAYLVGGYNGIRYDPWVLASAGGSAVRPVVRLPIPVRYPAVVARSGVIYAFGGERAGRPTAVIQRIDPRRRTAAVIGHLAEPLSHAAAIALRGTVFVLGGVTTSGHSSRVWRFRVSRNDVVPAGRLPYPVSDAGAAVVGNVAYLVGGEDPRLLATVIRLRAARIP